MDIASILVSTLAAGHSSLDEFVGKSILTACGIPTVEEVQVTTGDEAVTAATALTFPVVLKGMGRKLLHKSEQGLVHLGLASEAAVKAAAKAVQAAAGEDLEGFLVQKQIIGRRELLAGMTRDPQFGPLILFGVGGVLTEAIDDTVLGVAPLTRPDAHDIIGRMRARKLLDAFRGEAAVDREALADILLALSQLAMDHPNLAEIDLNPLIVTPQGQPVAVDALITLASPSAAPPSRQPVSPQAVGALFHPRSIAFVGASATFGKWGHMLPH
ncbi:MAG: acetate--CoA ligase family protein, partial [Desulfosarcinaceae bacterium]